MTAAVIDPAAIIAAGRQIIEQLRDLKNVPPDLLDDLIEVRDELSRVVRNGRAAARKATAAALPKPAMSTDPTPTPAPSGPTAIPAKTAPDPDRASGPTEPVTGPGPQPTRIPTSPRTTVPIVPRSTPPMRRQAVPQFDALPRRIQLLLAVALAVVLGVVAVATGHPLGLAGALLAAIGVATARRRYVRNAPGAKAAQPSTR